MKYYHLALYGLLGISLCAGCTDDILVVSSSEYLQSITVTGPKCETVDDTSTRALTIDGNKMNFAWALGDIIGIYPLRDAVSGNTMGEDQHAFPISNGAGTATASFDGGAWALRSNIVYAAYYPFSSDNYQLSPTEIPVTYLGQAQDGNGTSSHLSAYDYLVASGTQPNADGSVNLQLLRKGCIVELRVSMPIADTFTQVTVASSGTPFVTTGTIDLTAESPTITETATDASVSVDLANVTTTSNEEVLNVFFMAAPADLSTCQLTITVKGTTNKTYVATVDGKNLTANSWKRFTTRCTSGTNAKGQTITFGEVMDGNTHAFVDLGLPSGALWATCNVGAESAEQPGNYYAWGEADTKETYTAGNYSLYNSGYITKYCTNPDDTEDGVVDILINLQATDDVAHTDWGSNWKVPSSTEMQELIDNCTWTWTTLNGTSGYRVASAAEGNENWIFLPATGDYEPSKANTSYGYYWANGIDMTNNKKANYLKFGNSSTKTVSADSRHKGMAVRPVCYPVAATSVTLSQTSTQIVVGSAKTLSVSSIVPENVSNSQVVWTSTNTGVVTVDADGLITGIGEGSATVIATPISGCGVFAKCQVQAVIYEYVDLGITSNGKPLYWATCNIGASSPEQYGSYFAWGETTTKSTYSWTTYKHCKGTEKTQTKYCTKSDYGDIDNKTVLEPEDDAAIANWGGSWRMPTRDELNLLYSQCYWQWVESYNGKKVKGYVVYKAKAAADKGKYSYKNPSLSATYSVSSDAHIFLPAAGYRYGSSLGSAGSDGYYWSSSLLSAYPYCAYFLNFSSSYVYTSDGSRCNGRSVRPVCQ